MVQDFLADAGVRVLPLDVAAGQVRALRFRPSMGWLQMRWFIGTALAARSPGFRTPPR